MNYAIYPEKTPSVFVWRYETREEAEAEAKRICLEKNTEVEVFQRVCVFKPEAKKELEK